MWPNLLCWVDTHYCDTIETQIEIQRIWDTIVFFPIPRKLKFSFLFANIDSVAGEALNIRLLFIYSYADICRESCACSFSNYVSDQIRSVAQSCPTLCDPMNHSMPGPPVHHQLPEFTQTHVHQVTDAIQPSHPLSYPSPPAPNPSQHQSLFQWVNSSHEVAKVLEFQL